MKKDDRNIYISNMDADQAREEYFHLLGDKALESETAAIPDSLGRVTFEAVYAEISSPHYNAAAMDGIAVQAENTLGASEVNPKTLLETVDFQYINTGNMIPAGYNAVIMIEDVLEEENARLKIIAPAYPWQHIRPIGEDIVVGEMILPSRHRIRPVDLGALMAGGIDTLSVFKKPTVGIIPTGSELVESSKGLEDGCIIDSNSRVFEGLIMEYGGSPNRYVPQKDNYSVLKDVILKGVRENDILIIIAGSSAGTEDYTAKVIRDLGQVIVHGVALKPGKPAILGLVEGKPVIGVSGYPVSAYIIFDFFVRPLLLRYAAMEEEMDSTVKATITKRMVSSFKSKELIRVMLGYVGDKFVATPLTRGAGVTMSLVKADGIATIPRNVEGIEAGEQLEIKLLKPLSGIADTLVSIGSHDLIMDIISDKMKLSSGHVGSMGGVMAMRRRECHISPIHLMDEHTGQYNESYIRRHFPAQKMVLIKGVKRLQGFMVQRGNPMNITDFNDLTMKEINFVNRQRGAGTRILLDYHLKQLSINSQMIKGYEREMPTHIAVAVSIKTGSAHVGFGVFSAAKSLGLDFVPVAYENYDFLLYHEDLQDKRISMFIKILQSDEFQMKAEAIGGYEFENTGEIILIG